MENPLLPHIIEANRLTSRALAMAWKCTDEARVWPQTIEDLDEAEKLMERASGYLNAAANLARLLKQQDDEEFRRNLPPYPLPKDAAEDE